MVAKATGKAPETIPQAFTPYKEVLDVYDKGLKLPDDVASRIKGSRLAMLVDFDKIDNKTVAEIIKPLLGGTNKILYIKE